MKKSCNKMLRIVMSMAAAMLLVMIMSASAFAAEANENVKNASAGVVHIRVMYQGDGTDYDLQWGSGFLVNDMTVLTCFHVVYVDDATIGLMREDAVFGPLVEGKTDKQIRDRMPTSQMSHHHKHCSALLDLDKDRFVLQMREWNCWVIRYVYSSRPRVRLLSTC